MIGKTNAQIWFYERQGCLWFHLHKPSCADVVAEPFTFDGPATNNHINAYPAQFEEYVKKKKEERDAEVERLVKERLDART